MRAVCLDRQRVRRRSWRYDRRNRVLRVNLRVRRRSSVLTASRGRCARSAAAEPIGFTVASVPKRALLVLAVCSRG